MAFFPITYLEILIVLCMCFTYPSLTLKLFGSIYGWWVGLNTFSGEIWLNQNPSTGALSLTTQVTVFTYELSIIITVISLIQTIKYALNVFDMRKQKLTWREVLEA